MSLFYFFFLIIVIIFPSLPSLLVFYDMYFVRLFLSLLKMYFSSIFAFDFPSSIILKNTCKRGWKISRIFNHFCFSSFFNDDNDVYFFSLFSYIFRRFCFIFYFYIFFTCHYISIYLNILLFFCFTFSFYISFFLFTFSS